MPKSKFKSSSKPNGRFVTCAVTGWRSSMKCWSAKEDVTALCTTIVLELPMHEHYAKLITDTEPFTCQYCTLQTYRAMVIQLQTDVENLKSELASMKAALQARTPERRTENVPTKDASLSYAEATSGGGNKPQQRTTTPGTQPQSRSVSNK